MKPNKIDDPLKEIEWIAKLMDNKFRIPGTNIRFGLDAIFGLVPGVGDASTMVVSAFLVYMMIKKGAGGFVVSRMVLNILIDGIIGMIPLLGDIFDIGFRANTRNLKLMREHYAEGKHRGGAWKLVVPMLIAVLAIFSLCIWMVYVLLQWSFICLRNGMFLETYTETFYMNAHLNDKGNTPRPGEANTDAVQPEGENERYPSHLDQEKVQGRVTEKDEERILKQQQDRGLSDDIHQPE